MRIENAGAENSVRRDRIRGCLIGGAAGDALGYAVEFMGERQIFSQYGPQGIREYDPDPATHRAIVSDDTQMTLFTANGILVADTLSVLKGRQNMLMPCIFTAYQDWLTTQDREFASPEHRKKRSSWLMDVPELFQRRAPGNTCISALRSQRSSDVFGSIEEPVNLSKGCGGVMRAAPMGLKAFADSDIETIDMNGARLAAITHGHSLAYMPAAVLAHIVHRAVYTEQGLSLKETVTDAKETVARLFEKDPHVEALNSLLDRAIGLSENGGEDLANIHSLGEGWTGDEALAIAVYCALRYPDDFSAGITAASNHRGDSDSTASIAGNILGARLGFSAIPEKWKTDLELYDVITEIADDLFTGCRLSTGTGKADPDWERKYVFMRR